MKRETSMSCDRCGKKLFATDNGADCFTPECNLDDTQNSGVHCTAHVDYEKVEPGTPSSKWAEAGEPDPHGDRYDCDRAGLSLGEYTDDELANAVFMYGNVMPDIQDIISGKAMMPIVYLTAAKDRIRWLSRKLSEAIAHGSADGFPMQPVVVAEHGVVRFKENLIVSHLLECATSVGQGLNQIAQMDFSDDERMQLAQLIGYSVSGYCDLSYGSEESKDRASELAAALVGGAE